jgi:O-antigen/teichoic acid export membrane protein
MNRMKASQNPILQAVSLVIGVVITVAAVLVGTVLLSFIIGFVVLMGLLMYVRVWWARRRIKKTLGSSADGAPTDIVNVQYTVVKERNIDDQHHE